MRKLLVILAVTIAGCAQDARLPASYFAEGSRVLAPGQVSVTAVGGAGVTTNGGAAAGYGARVRVGVGGDQEVGVEAASTTLDVVTGVCVDDCGTEDDNQTERIRSTSAQASWKIRVAPQLALIAELGASHHTAIDGQQVGDYYGTSIGGSLALVTSRPITSTVDFYAGGRVAFELPIGPDNSTEAFDAVAVTGAFGFDAAMTDRLHLYVEAGPRAVMEGADQYVPWLSLVGVGGLRLTL
jgi:hypothetical protein